MVNHIQRHDDHTEVEEQPAEITIMQRLEWLHDALADERVRAALGEKLPNAMQEQVGGVFQDLKQMVEFHADTMQRAASIIAALEQDKANLDDIIAQLSRELHMLEKAEQPRMVELLAGEMAPMMGIFNRDLVRFLNVLLGHHDLGPSMEMLIREMIADTARMAMEDEIMDADAMSEIEF